MDDIELANQETKRFCFWLVFGFFYFILFAFFIVVILFLTWNSLKSLHSFIKCDLS